MKTKAFLPPAALSGRVLCSFTTCQLCSQAPRKPLCWESWSFQGNPLPLCPLPLPLLWAPTGGMGSCCCCPFPLFSPLISPPERPWLRLWIALLGHVWAGKCQASGTYLWLFFPSHSYFCSLEERQNVATVLWFTGVLEQTELSRCCRKSSEERKVCAAWGALCRGHECKHTWLRFKAWLGPQFASYDSFLSGGVKKGGVKTRTWMSARRESTAWPGEVTAVCAQAAVTCQWDACGFQSKQDEGRMATFSDRRRQHRSFVWSTL